MIIKSVHAKSILDSRKEKTIEVTIKTNAGNFKASSPTGKSTGKFEVKPYKKNLESDILTIKKFKDYFSEEIIENFDDLRRIEDILDGHVGGNIILAIEYATLKALATETKKEVWQLINPQADKFPRLVGNCIGGSVHSKGIEKRPDFQEFLLIPKTKTVKEAFDLNKKTQERLEFDLKEKDDKFKSKKNDENAWRVSLNDKEVLDILKKIDIPLGLDIAASNFYKRKKYNYLNPRLQRTSEEQLNYLLNLVKNYKLSYIEDAFEENDFDFHAKLLEKVKNCLIVGDDLTVTNSKRLKKAIEKKAINAIIIKPNQCGSLIEVKRVVEICKKNNIKMIFSHRSGATDEDVLADIAFGFGADFLKSGIEGKKRAAKIRRMIEIEKNFKQN